MRKPNPTATTTSSSASVVNITTTESQPSQVINDTLPDHTIAAPPHDIVLPASDPDDSPTSAASQPPTQGAGHGGYGLDNDMMADAQVGVGIYESEEGIVGSYEDSGGLDENEMDLEEDTTIPPSSATSVPTEAGFELGSGPAHPQATYAVGPASFPGPSSYSYNENWDINNHTFGWTYENSQLQHSNSTSAPPLAIMNSVVASPNGLDGQPYPQPAINNAQSFVSNDSEPQSDTVPNENAVVDALHITAGPTLQHPATLPPLNPTANAAHHTILPPPPPPPQALPPNPNFIPGGLNPTNADLVDFLRIWVLSAHNYPRRPFRERLEVPLYSQIDALAASRVRSVRFGELMGDMCDLQGVDWDKLGVSRETARRRRLDTYSNYTNNKRTDSWDQGELDLPNLDGYYRFQKMLMRRNVVLAHFQLRSVLACPSRNYAFYASTQGVHRINTATAHGTGDIAIDFSDMPSMQVTTLDANYGVLVAGTFNGEYFLKRLDSDNDRYANGQITNVGSPITNHLQLFQPRTSSPAVAFSSNDNVFRIMDVETERFLLTMSRRVPMNCSAISPDRRLRVMVGDQTNVLIVNAETGQTLQSLAGHRDFGFACDWSQDGWTVATGFQDKTVKIWDARRWCDSSGRSQPLTSIRSEMAGVRGLRFSPVGSGPRVLVAAEEADYVNIIEARNFETKQTFDLFGEIGGVAFTNDGHDLNVLVADKTRGGIVKLEQCGIGCDFDTDSMYQDWIPKGDSGPVIDHGWSHFPSWGHGLKATKKRRAAVREHMEPF